MKTSTHGRDLRRISFWIPLLLCFGINSAICTVLAIENPEYLLDYRLNPNPDAVHYVLLGRNTLLHGHFSRSESAPYVPDMLRTPVYPVFSGALDVVGKPLAIYLGQALLQLASCAILFKLVQRYFGLLTAFCASLFIAADTMWAISNFEALSEPLFVFLMLCSIERLANGLFSESTRKARLVSSCEAGVLLGLATLTRPVALYTLAFYLPIALLSGRQALRTAPRLLEVTILMAASLILPGAWIVRNYSTFSVPRLTTVDLNNLVFFVGAGAYQVERGLELKPAQQAVAEEFGLRPYAFYQNSQSTDYPVIKMVADLRQAWPRVVFKYPRSLCIASGLAIFKSIGSHNVVKLAEMTGRPWIAPKVKDLIRLRTAAIARLLRNWALLTNIFVWQLAHTLLAFGFALVGIVLVLRVPVHRPSGGLCLVCLFYYVLAIPLFGFDAYYRCRFPILPFLYVFSAIGVASFSPILKGRFRRPSQKPRARATGADCLSPPGPSFRE
jgi:4-amino-4-deoxy-L-arabinose transferase-like glycosyltransferase